MKKPNFATYDGRTADETALICLKCPEPNCEGTCLKIEKHLDKLKKEKLKRRLKK